MYICMYVRVCDDTGGDGPVKLRGLVGGGEIGLVTVMDIYLGESSASYWWVLGSFTPYFFFQQERHGETGKGTGSDSTRRLGISTLT